METYMLKIKNIIAQKIAEKLLTINPDAAISVDDVAKMLEYPPDAAMGDLALPCFKLSKTMRRSPVQIADALTDGYDESLIAKVENVNGYLNFYISNNYLLII